MDADAAGEYKCPGCGEVAGNRLFACATCWKVLPERLRCVLERTLEQLKPRAGLDDQQRYLVEVAVILMRLPQRADKLVRKGIRVDQAVVELLGSKFSKEYRAEVARVNRARQAGLWGTTHKER